MKLAEQLVVIKLKESSKLVFDCGDEDLNDFLKNNALTWQKQKHCQVFLFQLREKIVGFLSLNCDSVRLSDQEKEDTKKIPDHLFTFPAIMIGRLAVDKEYHSQGIGSFILRWGIGRVLDISKEVGCRFVTVDAYPDKVDWYSKRGFEQNEKKKGKRVVSMRYDLFNVENT